MLDNDTELAVMVGNAVTRFGLFAGEELKASWEASTPARLPSDEARLQLIEGFAAFARAADEGPAGSARAALEGLPAVLGSVVPALSEPWREALRAETGKRPVVVGPRLRTGMAFSCKNPAEVGADRVADAVAARELVGFPAIVVHEEAVLALTALDRCGALAGGIIAPGLASAASVVSHTAAKLPEVELAAPQQALGRTTSQAIASGLFWGEAARIDGLVSLVAAELTEGEEEGERTVPVLMTGDAAHLLAPHLRCAPRVEPDLTLRGLAACARLAAQRR